MFFFGYSKRFFKNLFRYEIRALVISENTYNVTDVSSLNLCIFYYCYTNSTSVTLTNIEHWKLFEMPPNKSNVGRSSRCVRQLSANIRAETPKEREALVKNYECEPLLQELWKRNE